MYGFGRVHQDLIFILIKKNNETFMVKLKIYLNITLFLLQLFGGCKIKTLMVQSENSTVQ
jgi:hypothetical protein